MEITDELVEEIKKALRVTSPSADGEIRGLIKACIAEMRIADVCIRDLEDPMSKQAVILYCKGHYGYDEKAEGFLEAYRALRDAMALCGEYKEKENGRSNTDY